MMMMMSDKILANFMPTLYYVSPKKKKIYEKIDLDRCETDEVILWS